MDYFSLCALKTLNFLFFKEKPGTGGETVCRYHICCQPPGNFLSFELLFLHTLVALEINTLLNVLETS